MANALPFILAGGAALLLFGKKKKKKRKVAPAMEYVQVDIPPPPKPPAKAPTGVTVPSEIWKQRQTALAYLGGLGICDCNPGLPDGIYGKNTRDAILGFQAYANIGRTGKWDQPTATMMSRALEMAAKGLIKVPKVKPATEPAKRPESSRPGMHNCPYGKIDAVANWIRENVGSSFRGQTIDRSFESFSLLLETQCPDLWRDPPLTEEEMRDIWETRARKIVQG